MAGCRDQPFSAIMQVFAGLGESRLSQNPKQPSLKEDISLATTKVVEGARLRKIRLARGLTQEELASATGVSRSAVAQWETGRAGLVDKLQRIANALGVPVRAIRASADRVDLPVDPGAQMLENDLLSDFRGLSSDDQAAIRRLVRRLRRDAF